MIGLRKMPLPSHDSETHAAYFMLGLARVSVLHDMDGQIEHAQQLCRWASIMADLEQVGAGIVKDYPGCIQYEVSEPFGEWYGWKAVRGEVPTDSEAIKEIKARILHFFAPDPDTNEYVSLFIALRFDYALPVPHPRPGLIRRVLDALSA